MPGSTLVAPHRGHVYRLSQVKLAAAALVEIEVTQSAAQERRLLVWNLLT